MKQKLLIALVLLLVLVLGQMNVWGQTTIFTEDFDDNSQYSVTLGGEGNDGISDYFQRTDGTNINKSYTDKTGTYFFAGQDIDDGGWTGSASPSQLTWSSINISGFSSIQFKGYFASTASAKIDNSDYVHIVYRIDGGAWTNLIWFENDGATYNTAFLEDTDFDGNGDGTQLTGTFTQFTKSIATVGSVLDFQFTASVNSGDEDIAIDYFQLVGTPTGGNLPPSITNIINSPTIPGSAETVSVSADVTDNDGTVNGVELHWGTTTGVLSNTIAMSVGTAPTYTTDTDIPAQANGTTVFYEIYALDDDADETTSAEQSYTVVDLASQPLAHVSGFAAGTPTSVAIPLSWTDSDAEFYLIKGVETGGAISDPVDGAQEANGALVYNIAKGAGGTYTFTGLAHTTTYDFKIFPYNGSGTSVNYLTDPTVPSVTASTLMPSATIPYSENFTDCGTQLWTPVSVASNKDWTCGAGYQSINGYGGDEASDDYLISPIFNMDNYTDEILLFDSYNQYADVTYPPIELLYTDNYTGDPTSTTWTSLPATWCPENGTTWTSSGSIDVSAITGTTIQFAFHYTSSGTGAGSSSSWRIDNIDLQQIAVDAPMAFAASASSTSQIDLTFTRNVADDDVVIVYNSTDSFTTPSGTPPAVGQSFAGGTLLYNGSTSPQTHTGLSPLETVYYMAYSFDGSNYSPGVSANATTQSTEPTNHVTGISATANSSSSITVGWTDSDAAFYLVKGSASAYGDIAVPTDGVAEADATLVKNVSQGTGSADFTGLNASTTYYFKIYPYNGTDATINYKTDGTVPQDEATTEAAPVVPAVFISEYIEGSSNNKAIEIYNGEATAMDMSDFSVKLFANGAASATNTWTGSGMLESGDTYILYNSLSGTTITEKGNETPAVTAYNGDDAIGLYYNDYLIDVVGVIGVDPGTGWDVAGINRGTLDHTIVRKPTITTGNTNWTTSAGTGYADSEWRVFDQDHFFNLGVFGTGWTGATDNDWATLTNWDVQVPDATVNALINAAATTFPTIATSANCKNLTIESMPTAGDASLLGQSFLTVSGTTIVQRYTTANMWHSVSAPLGNDDFNSLYLNNNPTVWASYYDEASKTYIPANLLSTPLGDAKGWMVWVGGSEAQTFDFTGDLRSGSVGPIALTNSLEPDHGYNFVGNPYPSAIDWDASGWTKTNCDNGIWIWDAANTNWATYNSISGTNNGSNFIPIGQGFFVQVDPTEATGSLVMTTDIQVHDGVDFMKSTATTPANFIKLKLADGDMTDESVIHLNASGTEGYDSQLDMHKMFSWNNEQPQLYSTANNFLTVNVLPLETVSVPMDVRGKDGNEMTIAIEEVTDFAEVYLSDDYTGVQTNLMEDPYTFIYDAGQTDRFTVYFTIVGTMENPLENVQVYGFDKKIRVIIPTEMNARVEVNNMLGQTVGEMDAHMGTHEMNIVHQGYYLVTITGDNQRIVRKVFIK